MRGRPYPAYRPSGVDVLGGVPAHWRVVPLKHLCRRSALYGANIPAEDYSLDGVRFLRTTDIGENGELMPGGVFVERDEINGYLLTDGDLLISRSGTVGRGFCFDASRHPECAFAGYLVRFVPGSDLVPRFAFYFTQSLAFEDWIETQIISSTIGNVNGQKYAQCRLPCPAEPEQDTIATFLDRETARIDTLIEKKRTLIERLKEKRSALISRTVTRGLPPQAAKAAGLSPHPRMKDSGVEWLGEVPEHWEVVPLRRIASLRSGESITSEELLEGGDFPVFGGNGVRGSFDGYTHDGEYVLIGRQGALCGNINYASGRFWASEHAVVVSPTREIAPLWLGELLREMKLNQYSLSAAQPGLSVDRILPLKIPVPPFHEQQALAAFLSAVISRTARVTGAVEAAIERLSEYRAALITAAVTGKIDVREVAA